MVERLILDDLKCWAVHYKVYCPPPSDAIAMIWELWSVNPFFFCFKVSCFVWLNTLFNAMTCVVIF